MKTMDDTSSFPALPVETRVGNYFISNYPPYSQWNEKHIPYLFQALSRTPKPSPLGLYVHIPFCRQRCSYCYFRVYPRRSAEDVNGYIDTVLKELSFYVHFPALQSRRLSSVYFGGGSPSYLDSDQLQRLFEGLQSQQRWESVEETTFECEPGTVSTEKLIKLKSLGVTRVSLGFQTLEDEVLRRNGREATKAQCIRAFHDAREAGFDEINVDLLAGLPGETEESWLATIDAVLDLAPDCITIYQFELTYNSALYQSIRAGREVAIPSWPVKRQWVAEAFRRCEEAGYVIGSGYMAIRNPQWWRFVYTVDNFWHGGDLIGLGESAFGHIQGVHYQNADTFDRYLGLVARGFPPVSRALRLRPEEKLRREVVLLLKTGSIDLSYFRAKFHTDLLEHFAPQFEELARKGLIEREGDILRLKREALLEVDWLLPMFYLPEHRGVRYT